MLRKIGLLAVLGTLVLAAGSAPAQAILCPYISHRCCYTETAPSGCPYCVCYIGQPCC